MSEMDRDGQLWILNEFFGIKSIPPAEDSVTGLKAALICAKADGALAPEERNWVVGRAATLRNPGYELAKTYPADENLLEVIPKSSTVDKSGRRLVIYVAIKACAADGEYHPSERAKVHKMAKALGIEEDVVNQIEELCVSEAKIREQRIGLIFPDGVPY